MNAARMKFVTASTLVALIGLTAHAHPPAKNIADALQPFVENHTIAGAVTLVADKDKVISLETVGYADLAANKPIRPDNLFWIASMTKPVTATAVLMLQDDGKLSVDDPAAKYLPELANLKTVDGKAAKLTLRHLLTHISGMGEATPQESRAAGKLADLIPHYAEKPLQFEPGTKWQYCQSGINSLGRIVEVVSGQPLPEFLQKRLFDPLGMKDTTFYPTQEQLARLAKSYKAADGKLEETTIFILDGHDPASRDRYPAANGGLFSTARDYGRFCQMLLNQGSLGGRQYLTPESVKAMNTIQTGDLKTGFTEGNGWGLGCCVVRKPQGVTAVLSPGTFGHGGAYGTQAWIDPVKQVVYVLMVQRSNFPNADASDVRRAFQEAAVATVTGKP
ncbi:MAG: serine hydrolase domain-containing protein [Thermoguttaceae bacterium]|jgi:CubicO group peptidase (beta-lactamase class C family)